MDTATIITKANIMTWCGFDKILQEQIDIAIADGDEWMNVE